MSGASTFIDPKVLASLKNLKLSAKTVAEGFLHGIHTSKHLGSGLSFSQYKPYQSGDDLRFVDWKLYARSKKLYLKQDDLNRSIELQIVIDATNSMTYSEEPWSKWDYACHLGASLAYIATEQGDSVGLQLISSNGIKSYRAKKGKKQFERICSILESISPEGSWPDESKVIYPQTQQSGIVIFISDFYQQNSEIINYLKLWNTSRRRSICFHIWAAKEKALEFDSTCEFVDLESGKTLITHPSTIKEQYISNWEKKVSSLKKEFTSQKMDFNSISIQEELDHCLNTFLGQRNRFNS